MYKRQAPTNLQLYRKFMEKYLRQRPEVNTDLTLMVRHMEATQCGLPIEFYFFIKDKVWAVSYTHLDVYKRQEHTVYV